MLELQQKASARRKSGLFVVEGRRELAHCLAAGYEVASVFVAQDSELLIAGAGGVPGAGLTLKLDDKEFGVGECAWFEVAPNVYERIAYRDSTEGIVALVKAKELTLEELAYAAGNPPRGVAGSIAHAGSEAAPGAVAPPLFIVLESVEKPGNLGAVLRSADAAAATAVIVCDPLTDLYNPNLIRASVGARFTVPMVACTSAECIAFLKAHGVHILTAQLQDSHVYYHTDMTGPTAIVMGTESTGLTEQWRRAADAHLRIPMLGQLDSLNVSVSAAILLFEAVRQRKK